MIVIRIFPVVTHINARWRHGFLFVDGAVITARHYELYISVRILGLGLASWGFKTLNSLQEQKLVVLS